MNLKVVMMTSAPMEPDDTFYDRADQFIHLANEQLEAISRGKVSASFMYANARYTAWVSACGFTSGDDRDAAKYETIEYFVNSFRTMLEENLDDYISNFATYMQSKPMH